MSRVAMIPVHFVPFPGTLVQLRLADAQAVAAFRECMDLRRPLGFIFHEESLFGAYHVEEGGVGCLAEIRAVHGEGSDEPRVMAVTQGRFVVLDSLEVTGALPEAVVEPYEDEPAEALQSSDGGITARREGTLDLFRAALRALPGPRRALPRMDCQQEISFRLAPSVGAGPSWKQHILEMRDERKRLDRLDAFFLDAIARHRAPAAHE